MKASVIIPYTEEGPDKVRMESYLAAQTCRDFETLFIHDAKRQGPAWARNCALSQAQGEVILFADVDDEIASDWIERMLEGLGEADLAWAGYNDVQCPTKMLRGDAVKSYLWRSVFGYRLRDLINLVLPGGIWRRCHREMSGVWRLAVRRSTLGDVRFDETLRLYEDAMYIAALAAKAQTLAIFGSAGYTWRPTPFGTMAQGFSRECLVANKFAVRNARHTLDPKMSHWRGSYLLSAGEILRLAGLRTTLRYLLWYN